MENIRSLRDVRKQHKEQALAASKGSMAPQPSPPISECDFQSSASMLGNNDQSEDMKQDSKDEDNAIIQSETNIFLDSRSLGWDPDVVLVWDSRSLG